MAGGITDTGELYSPSVGLVYMFNLIVGTGALTMPKAFATAGWVVSLVLISVLAFMSYITTTFVIEAMAAANAQLRWKRRENQKFAVCDRLRDELYALKTTDGEEEVGLSGSASIAFKANLHDVSNELTRGSDREIFTINSSRHLCFQHPAAYAVADLDPLLFIGASQFRKSTKSRRAVWCTCCSRRQRQMEIVAHEKPTPMNECPTSRHLDLSIADGGSNATLFYFVGCSHLFLCLLACHCPRPLSSSRRLTGLSALVFQTVFTLLLGPFTFFNVQKTKYLQIGTSLMRWIAFTTMIILALIRIGKGKGEGHPPAAVLLGVPNLFGVCVYSFMCQHSLPSVVTPISDKRRVSALVLLDYVLILSFYSLLSFTAIFCFDSGVLKDMYTLNFTDSCDVIGVAFLRYFLGLFPVFTISTNFPIIAVTLRNNWKTLFHRGGTYPWVVDRVVFPLITLVPPIIVAFCTHDLETLVGITGAFAGTGIQYIIPACLVYFGRKDVGLTYGDAADNKHRSPFHHVFWVWFVLVWAGSCLMFVTANIVLTETKH
ncbi:transmembrane protein 104-like [Polypterus senegalus]|uniref:transmembrane protein 104-like n=1 Tax=Polypterus senegalus TaxID=55291 RepID=UPI0019665894|nr:transmembrane protein 104-like [Polypterus senegalus]